MSQKKKEFMEKQNKKIGGNRVFTGVLVFLVIIAAAGAYIKINGETPDAVRWEGGNYTFEQSVDYTGKIVTQTNIELMVEDGKAIIPLEHVSDNGFIYTEYNKDGFRLPLMSYINPSGRLVAAISFCEPCRSQSFHINGDQLICDSCNTRWELATMKGIMGGCMDYPPEEIDYEVVDGNIIIKEQDIRLWTPRDLSAAR